MLYLLRALQGPMRWKAYRSGTRGVLPMEIKVSDSWRGSEEFRKGGSDISRRVWQIKAQRKQLLKKI